MYLKYIICSLVSTKMIEGSKWRYIEPPPESGRPWGSGRPSTLTCITEFDCFRIVTAIHLYITLLKNTD